MSSLRRPARTPDSLAGVAGCLQHGELGNRKSGSICVHCAAPTVLNICVCRDHFSTENIFLGSAPSLVRIAPHVCFAALFIIIPLNTFLLTKMITINSLACVSLGVCAVTPSTNFHNLLCKYQHAAIVARMPQLLVVCVRRRRCQRSQRSNICSSPLTYL